MTPLRFINLSKTTNESRCAMEASPFKLNLLPKKELIQVTLDTGRYYLNPETNEKFDSVTTVLKNALDMSWLESWKARVGDDVAEEISKQARDRGTMVHAIMEDYVLGRHNDTKQSAFLRKAIRSIKKNFQENVSEIYGVELPVYSTRLNAAGTFDLFSKYKVENTVIDYKTSRHYKNREDIWHYFIQASVYSQMIEELYGIEVPKILIVMIYGNGDVDFFNDDAAKYRDDVTRIFENR